MSQGTAPIDRRLARTVIMCAAIAVLAMATACVSEESNRAMYKSNKEFDDAVLRPMVLHYNRTVPEPIREGVSNFFQNLRYGEVVVNQALQGKAILAHQDMQRWVINTVAGVGGIFDVATELGLEKHDEDFGQTLANWGAKEGCFVVLPILGPGTERDHVGRVMGMVLTPTRFLDLGVTEIPVAVASFGSRRIDVEPQLQRIRDEEPSDEYLFVKNAFLQRRRFQICDGKVPEGGTAEDEALLDDLDDVLDDETEVALDDATDDAVDDAVADDGDLPGLDDLPTHGDDALPGLDDLDDPAAAPDALPGLDELDAPSG